MDESGIAGGNRPAGSGSGQGQEDGAKRGLVARFLDAIEWLGNKLPEPALLFVGGAALVMVLSQLIAWAGWSVQPVRLEPVMQAVVDADGTPVLDEQGEPVMEAVIGAGGRAEFRVVDDAGKAPVSARSLLSGDGLYWAISSMVDNFVRFPPLGVVLVGVLGVGVAERTGFIGAALKAFMVVVPRRLLTPAMVFLGVMSSLGTDAGYVVLPPIGAALYKALGRSPLAGIAAVFAGIAGGFSANLLITSLDPLLVGYTQPAARALDPDITVPATVNWWFMMVSTVALTLVGWAVSAFVERRFAGKSPEDGGASPVSKAEEAEARTMTPAERKGLAWASVVLAVSTGVFVAMWATPNAPLDDKAYVGGRVVTHGMVRELAEWDARRYIAPNTEVREDLDALRALLASEGREAATIAAAEADDDAAVLGLRRLSSAERGMPGTDDHADRWIESIVPALFFLFVLPGMAYGAGAGTVTSAAGSVRLMTETMASMAPVIVLSFFAAQFIEYFKYSRMDQMLAYSGGEALVALDMPRELLMVVFILVVMLFNLLIASSSAKFAMFAPIFVPMFMLVGIHPALTQAAYRVGDSCTNMVTPMNAYIVIILAVAQRYAPRSGLGTIISMMIPYSVAFGVMWIVMLLVWMQTGVELGPGGPLWYQGGE
ncbi:MAG: AbgT family transporter [Phycisphaerales bacterium]